MHVLLLICHPDPGSFTHALAQRVSQTLLANQHTCTLHDLYQEQFDPVLPYAELKGESSDALINQHIAELQGADGLVIVHPNWWGKPPAMLAGWIDRVLRVNAAYSFPKGQEGGPPIGLLRLKKALILNTSNTTLEREEGVFGDPLELIWKNCVLGFCGVDQVTRHTFRVVVDSSLDERAAWLAQVVRLTLASFPGD